MPVVIDDFQVVAEPPSDERPAAAPAPEPRSEGTRPVQPSPREVELVVERRFARLARVRAH
jgi:hypothetical protein